MESTSFHPLCNSHLKQQRKSRCTDFHNQIGFIKDQAELLKTTSFVGPNSESRLSLASFIGPVSSDSDARPTHSFPFPPHPLHLCLCY